MNTVHRENIEQAFALEGEQAEKPEVIPQRTTSYIDSIDE